VDLRFPAHPALRPLPRAAYALLRSPLLSPAAQAHVDLTAYLRHLWGGLPAGELSRAVYPSLSAWADASTLLAAGLDLSRASLEASFGAGGGAAAAAAGAGGAAAPAPGGGGALRPAEIWVLDAYILILVLRRQGRSGGGAGAGAGGAAQQPWAPPQDSALWQSVVRTRQVGMGWGRVRRGRGRLPVPPHSAQRTLHPLALFIPPLASPNPSPPPLPTPPPGAPRDAAHRGGGGGQRGRRPL
jgi:hypothetical protein